jgi:hypothetical protein
LDDTWREKGGGRRCRNIKLGWRKLDETWREKGGGRRCRNIKLG